MQNLGDGSFTAVGYTVGQYPLASSSEIGSTKPNRNLMRQRKHAASNEIAIQRRVTSRLLVRNPKEAR